MIWTPYGNPQGERNETYAVVNPATGETIKEYPEISDAELRAAIERADEASRTWSRSSTVAERAALVRKVGELHPSAARSWPRSSSARWASRSSRR